MNFVTLQISFSYWNDHQYAITFARTSADDEGEARWDFQIPRAAFEPAAFLEYALDPEKYGRALSAVVFKDPTANKIFVDACAKANNPKDPVPLRVQLVLNPQMGALHDLQWETLRHPETGLPLFVRDDMLFSRYLWSDDTRPIRARGRDDLRALVGVAAPDDLAQFGLAPIDEAAELDRIKAALAAADIDVKVLNTPPGQVSLGAIVDELRADPDGYDILYLVCHGALVEGEPRLWLEKPPPETPDPDRPGVRSAIVSGATLADRLAALANRPRLVVLMSCEGAGRSQADGRALAAVGPRLARAGIPAVVAMQGQVSMATAGRFVPAFFKALRQDGQIDRAVAVARAAVEGEPDAWMPVLFMRMNTGRLWVRAGLQGGAGASDRFDQWDELLDYINTNKCTPIVGPEVTEDLFGSQQEIARRWADLYQYPLADHHRGDLSQVAQYLSDVVSVPRARSEFVKYLRRELVERYGDDVPALHTDAHLADVLRDVGRWKRDRDRDTRGRPAGERRPDTYQVLADLRCPLYLTANPDALLADALRDQPGVQAVYERGFDRDLKTRVPDPLFETDGYKPRPDKPLVYHLFGRYQIDPEDDTYDLQKLVFTQDDYFQYLTAMGHNWDAVPTAVRRALSKSALVFIGFRLHDWSFRVLLQSLVWRGWTTDNTYRHVAVQVDPGEGQFQNPDMARRYLRRIIQIRKELSIYWGDTASFLRDLRARIPARPPVPVASRV